MRRRRCGKPRCRCIHGHPHSDRVLAVHRAGRVALRAIDPVAGGSIEEGVAAWRAFRRDRMELAESCRGLLAAVERLGRMRQVLPAGIR